MKKNKTSQLKALFLLALFVFDLFRPYMLSASNSQGSSNSGDGPVAASASNYVDPFTGDFHYSVPLMVVPGPNGEAVDISASYHAGIGMDEKASWIGLGWDYNPGEITRSTNGVPDDGDGCNVLDINFRDLDNGYDATTTIQQDIFGPLYYSNFHNTSTNYSSNSTFSTQLKSFDVFIDNAPSNTADITSLPFRMPAYDKFMVSGPGIGGKIRPILRSVGALALSKAPNWSISTYSSIIPKPQFIFENSTAFNYPSNNSSYNVYANSNYYDNTDKRIIQGNYVKYFTNDEINLTGGSSILYNNSNHTGFLDYHTVSGTRRPPSNYIGGFQVTTPSGITYHYSLPVNVDNEYSISFGLDDNGDPNWAKRINRNQKDFAYPISWKLTAVTGSDYEDTNTDHMVSQGDKGYWIAYNYSLWTNDFNWCSSFFKYKQDINLTGFPSVGVVTANSNGDYKPTGIYSPRGSALHGTNQVYFLNNIQTATHTAFFVKDLRLDEHGYDHILNSSINPKPLLKLNRIILMRNEDAGLFVNNGSFPSNSSFDLANCKTTNSTNPNLVHVGTYNAHKTAIDNKTLKAVVFNTDYSLCQKLPNNINNTFSIQNVLFSWNRPVAVASGEAAKYLSANGGSDFVYAYPSSSTYAGSNGGKLTLNEILAYENGNTKIFPSYKFTYSNNADYDQDKTDLWGYYNSNYSPGYSHYNLSGAGPDAWSLTKVTTPLGGEINVTYGMDSYGGYYSNETQSGLSLVPPSYIFLVTSADNACPGNSDELYHMPDRQFGIMQGDFSGFSGGSTLKLYIPVKTNCVGFSQSYYGYITGDITGMSGSNPYDFTCASPLTINGWGAYNCATNSLVTSTMCSGYGSSGTTYYPTAQYARYSPLSLGYGFVHATPTSGSAYGGGLKVTSIEIKDPQSGQFYKQKYTYSGGICSANPDRICIKNHGIFVNNASSDVFAGAPVVGYGRVTVENMVGNTSQSNGSTVYEFFQGSTLPDYTFNSLGRTLYGRGAGTSSYCTSGSFIYKYPVDGYRITKSTAGMGLLGKPVKISSVGPNGIVVSYTTYGYATSNLISESFSNMNDYTDDDCTRASLPIPMYLYCGGTLCTACGTQMRNAGYALYTNIRDYTVFLRSTETYKDGIVTRQTILERDPFTAAPTKVLTEDPTQGGILNTTEFAYTRLSGGSLVYPSMGLKGCNGCITNQNNLTSVSESRVIKYPMTLSVGGYSYADITNPGLLIGGSKNVFTDQVPYRVNSSGHFINSTQSQLFWKPSESYQLAVDANTLETSTPVWRKTSTATSFNSANNALLEAKGLNDRYSSAVKMGYNNQYKIADISDASLDCFAFSSFEDGALSGNTGSYYGGEINGTSLQKAGPVIFTMSSGLFNLAFTLPAHTGNYMAKVPASGYSPTFSTVNFEKNRTYRASVWVNLFGPANIELKATLDGTFASGTSPIIAITSTSNTNNIIIGPWMLMTVDITVPAVYTASGGSLGQNDLRFFVQNNDTQHATYIDDLSVHPIDAPITGYVYNPLTGWLTATLDNENFATFYSYDQAGRVIKVSKETKNGVKKISETAYHFGRP